MSQYDFLAYDGELFIRGGFILSELEEARKKFEKDFPNKTFTTKEVGVFIEELSHNWALGMFKVLDKIEQ